MKAPAAIASLPASALYRRCDPKLLDFASTDELEPAGALVGQERATEALKLALGIATPGYDVFLMGPPGVGKHTFLQRVLDKEAAARGAPDDWCYVNRFADGNRPQALRLPAGRGAQLRDDTAELVDALRIALSAAFESEDYRNRRQILESEAQEHHETELEALRTEATAKNLTLLRSPVGFAFAPAVNGEVLRPELFSKLAEAEQKRIKADIDELQKKLQQILSEMPRLHRTTVQGVRALEREVTNFAVTPLFEDVSKRYEDLPEVTEWLAGMMEEVRNHAELFLPGEDPRAKQMAALAMGERDPQGWALRRYSVNLLVDRTGQTGAPVVYEDHPTLEHLVGRIEHRSQFGVLFSDFTLIRAGALHRANGGYLVLDARKLLMQPQAWEALKRCLRARQVCVESLGQSLGLSSINRISPEPVPVDVRVILLGDRRLYYRLGMFDPELEQLFKVAADFEDDIPRDAENVQQLARFIGGVASEEKLLPLKRAAVVRVVEHLSRLAGDAERLSTHSRDLADLLRESDYWARQAKHKHVSAADIELALAAQIRRSDRVRDQSLRMLADGVQLISTQGEVVGQINALSVLALGGFAFGRPIRITCRTRMGRGEILDIEREVQLGGPLHSKGVLILAGLLGARYARDQPLSLSASLVFEQSYGGVDGDSASLAEACALLSAIAEVPIQQRFAVTGSINQLGEVQAIGGVNEKIEGFFDACSVRGLTGEQGVLIPASNARHLMLRKDVRNAVKARRFAVYAVGHVDEALHLLTGRAPGVQQQDGSFEQDSLNAAITDRLRNLSARARELISPGADRLPGAAHGDVPEPEIPGDDRKVGTP